MEETLARPLCSLFAREWENAIHVKQRMHEVMVIIKTWWAYFCTAKLRNVVCQVVHPHVLEEPCPVVVHRQ